MKLHPLLSFFKLFLLLFISFSSLQAQKLLDPSGPISVVVSSSGNANTSIASAFSIRQLKTVYDHPIAITPPAAVVGFTNSATPLLRVRRNSDNGQLDIGYDVNGNLDTITLKNFVSNNGVNPTASGFVTVWYDQSGNSRDLYQVNTAQQPRVINAGVVERNPSGQVGIAGISGGMLEYQSAPGVPFNNPNGINIYGIDGNRTLNVVCQPRAFTNGTINAGDGTYLIDRNGSTGDQDRPLTSIKAVSNAWAAQIRNLAGTITNSIAGTVSISTNRSDNVNVLRSGDLYYMYVNGVFAGSSILSGDNSMTPLRIGYGTNTGENVYYGECILFPTALAANDLIALDQNQDLYFVLGPPPNSWTGLVSSNWHTAGNWSTGVVPDLLTRITIPSGTPFSPVISSSASARSITIQTGATLTNNNTFSINDNIVVNGTYAGTGTTIFNGGLRQTISGTTSPIVFNNVAIANTIDRIIAQTNLNISGTFTVNTGATFEPEPAVVINAATPTGTITGNGTILVTRVIAQPDYQSQYRFATNTLTNLTVNYAGAGDQTINLTGVVYGPLTISGTGVKSLNADATSANIGGAINVTAATFSNGGFSITGNNTRNFIVANNARFLLLGSSAFPTGYTNLIRVASTVEYGGSGTQTISAQDYGFLVSSGTGDRILANTGTIRIARTFTPGTNVYTNTNSTIEYNNTAAQTIAAFRYNNLTISQARGGTNITLAAGVVEVQGVFSLTATSVGAYNVNNNTFAYTGTNQTVASAIAYHNLTLGGSGIKTTAGVTVNRVMTLEGSATVNASITYGSLSTIRYNKTVNHTTSLEFPSTFSGNGGVIVANSGVVQFNELKAITRNLSIESGAKVNLSTFSHTADGLILDGVGQTNGTFGGATSSASNINTTFFEAATGIITITTISSFWTGAIDNNWHNAGNWSPAAIPTEFINIIIPSAPVNQPIISAAAICKDLTIQSGAILTANNTLTMHGSYSNSGTANYNTSNVILAGTSNQSIGYIETAGNLIIQKNGGTTVTFIDSAFANDILLNPSGGTVSYTVTVPNLLHATGNLVQTGRPGNNSTVNFTGAGRLICNNLTIGNTLTPSTNAVTLFNSTLTTVQVNGNVIINSYINGGNTNNSTLTLTSGTASVSGQISTNNAGITNTSTFSLGTGVVLRLLGGGNSFSLSGTGSSTITLNASNAIVDYIGTTAQIIHPTTYAILRINNQAGVSLAASTTVNTLTIGNTTANSIFNDAGFTLTPSGTSTINITSGIFNIGSLTVATSWPNFTNRNFTAGTTVAYVSGVTQSVSSTPSYRNLIFSGAGVKNITTATTLSVNGNWTVSGGNSVLNGNANASVTGNIQGTGNIVVNTGTISIAGNWSNTGTLTPNTGTVNYNGTGAQMIAPLQYHNLTVSTARVGFPIITLASGTIRVSGNATLSATNIGGYNNVGNTVDYNGAGAQTVAPFLYNNLTISTARTGSPTITFSDGITGIANVFSITATGVGSFAFGTNNTVDYDGTGAQTILALNYRNLTISGSRSASPTVTFASATVGVSGNFNITATGVGSYVTTANTIDLNGTNAQTFPALAYNNLTASGSNTKTATGAVSIANQLTINSGVTVNMSTFVLSGSVLTTSGTGTLSTQNTTATPLPAGRTWTGTVNYNNTAGSQTVVQGIYNNLTLGNTSGTQSATANLVVNGTLTTTAGGTLSLLTFELGGTLTTINHNGIITTANTGSTPLPNGRTWGGTVTYNAATGTQTIVAGTYSNITLANNALKNANGNITVNGVLNLAANQNNNRGHLEMTISYAGYADVNDVNSTSSNNNLNSHILTMGPSATTTGAGDVTGKIRRTSFVSGTPYSFGNANTLITFSGASLPSQITVVNTRGSEGLHVDKSDAVRRLYQVLRTGGSSPTTMTLRLAYDDSELNGNTESNLILWDHHIPYAGLTPHEHGKTNQNTTSNWVELASHGILYLEPEGDVSKTKYWMISNKVSTDTIWGGAVSGGDWNIPSNWNIGIVPSSTTRVVIPDASLTPNDPVINGSISVGAIEITPNGVLNGGTGTLTLNGGPAENGGSGTWLNNGTFTAGSGTVVFNNNNGTIAGSTVFNNVTIATGRKTTIQDNAQITINGTLAINGTGVLDAASNLNTITYTGTNPTIVNPNATPAGYRNLVLSGTGTAVTASTLEVKGNFTLNQAVDFTTNSTNLILSGTSAQQILGTYPGTFHSFTLNNPTGYTLPANTTFNGSLVLTNGILNATDKNITLNGGFSGSASNAIRFDGTNQLTIGGSGSIGSLFFDQSSQGVSNRVADLIYNRASTTIPLGNTIQVVNSVVPTAGTLNANGNLVLVSTLNKTARVASSLSVPYMTGTVIAQRHIPDSANRTWRFLSSPVSGTTFDDWRQEIFVTGPGTGGSLGTTNSAGFDFSPNNNSSVFTYNESAPGNLNQGWVSPTNINQPIVTGVGYRVFVRGDRSNTARLTSTTIPQNEVVIDTRGTLNQGSISVPVTFTSNATMADDGWNLVGNPYFSNYDWNAFYDNPSTVKTNLSPTAYLYDAKNRGYWEYNALSDIGTGFFQNGIIPNGAAFWVKAIAASPAITFIEDHKVATAADGNFYKTTNHSVFRVRLYGNGLMDEIAVKYMQGASKQFDAFDILKMEGQISLAAFDSDQVMLSATVRPLSPTLNDTIWLNINGANGTYQLQFANVDAIPVADQVYLIDNHANQVVNLNTTSSYSFNINSTIPSTLGNGRFYIVVANTNTVPVELMSFNARGNSSQQVELNWETASELNTSHFEIERSADGNTFETLMSVKAIGKAGKLTSYTQTDRAPHTVGYYRLKMVDKDGSYAHSAIRMVRFDNEDLAASLKMYPVPASKSLTIELGETMNSIRIYNAMGKQVYTGKASADQAVVPVETLAAGVYTIEIMTETGSRVVERFVKE